MSRLSKNDRKWLEEKFGDRANFSPTERLLYGHDITGAGRGASRRSST